MRSIHLSAGCLLLTVLIGGTAAGALADNSAPAMLPAGYLSTHGNQIVDSRGNPVRIDCVGGLGTDIVGGALGYGYGSYNGLDNNIQAMRKLGFNCIRADFNDNNVSDPAIMSQFDQLVAACGKYGVKVILDHHNNEATGADWGNAAQQTNGLWYDLGPGTDGTDGAHDTGTVTRDKFEADWVKMAKHWAGNSTVIGFDLDNEPHIGYGQPDNGENWGAGGPGDICAMYTSVGKAIQKVDPGALIICEGLMDVTDKSSPIWWDMDLSHVQASPVVLTIPNKVVYSVHEYPKEVSGSPTDNGPSYIIRMNEDWGFLESKNIAPVWVGELGAPTSASDADGNGFVATILPYLNGRDGDSGGPVFSGNDQPISTDIWRWGSPPGTGDGILDRAGEIRPEISSYADGLLFKPKTSE